jgi:hypothetical protein
MAQPKIGDLDNGGVYVGKSATTGEDLHASLADEPEYLTWDDAIQAAEEMRKQPPIAARLLNSTFSSVCPVVAFGAESFKLVKLFICRRVSMRTIRLFVCLVGESCA